jgi:two-component system NtrC family sensor kinase
MLVPSSDRLLWAVRVRWLVIAGFLLLALVAHALGLFASVAPCLRAAVVGAVINGANEWSVRRRRAVLLITAVAIPFDHILITYVVVNTGAVRSPFVMMYVVQVLATAMLVGTRVAAGSAMLAMACWGAGIGLETVGTLRVPPLFVPGADHVVQRGALYKGMWAAFLLYCLALLVYLGGYISERLGSSERELEENNRRLQDALHSLRNAHGELSGAYDRLKQAEAHLIQSEKMRGLGELVAGVAHELSNPISFISANVEHLRTYMKRLERALDAYARTAVWPAGQSADALRRELRIDETLADLPGLLDDCEEGARRTKRIVTELRTFARSDERDGWQRADLHRGLDSTLALLAHRLKDGIAVHRDYGELPDVECLPGQLNQVFMNLLANAADAIGPRPGNIWIVTRAPPRAAGESPSVTIAVRDDGPGIPPDLQAKIFDPFFTTKEVGQGTGLGLSVSYGIVQRHRGSLTVDSTPGAGSTFTLALPVSQPHQHPPAA